MALGELISLKKGLPIPPLVILLARADCGTVWKMAKSCYIDSVIFKPFKLNDFEKTVKGALELKQRERGIKREI
jgi:DNA-binding NtrC family response regulator